MSKSTGSNRERTIFSVFKSSATLKSLKMSMSTTLRFELNTGNNMKEAFLKQQERIQVKFYRNSILLSSFEFPRNILLRICYERVYVVLLSNILSYPLPQLYQQRSTFFVYPERSRGKKSLHIYFFMHVSELEKLVQKQTNKR